jgi:hypothetical protein
MSDEYLDFFIKDELADLTVPADASLKSAVLSEVKAIKRKEKRKRIVFFWILPLFLLLSSATILGVYFGAEQEPDTLAINANSDDKELTETPAADSSNEATAIKKGQTILTGNKLAKLSETPQKEKTVISQDGVKEKGKNNFQNSDKMTSGSVITENQSSIPTKQKTNAKKVKSPLANDQQGQRDKDQKRIIQNEYVEGNDGKLFANEETSDTRHVKEVMAELENDDTDTSTVNNVLNQRDSSQDNSSTQLTASTVPPVAIETNEIKGKNYLFLNMGTSVPIDRKMNYTENNFVGEGLMSPSYNVMLGIGHRFPSNLNLESGLQFGVGTRNYTAAKDSIMAPSYYEYDDPFYEVDLIDLDGNGLPDALDFDGDGFPDFEFTEGSVDTNGDGVPDYLLGLIEDGVIVGIPEPVIDSTLVAAEIDQKEIIEVIDYYKLSIPLFVGYEFSFGPKFSLNTQVGCITSTYFVKSRMRSHYQSEMVGTTKKINYFSIAPSLKTQAIYSFNRADVFTEVNLSRNINFGQYNYVTNYWDLGLRLGVRFSLNQK